MPSNLDRIEIRCTPEEKEDALKRAEKEELSVSNFGRKLFGWPQLEHGGQKGNKNAVKKAVKKIRKKVSNKAE